MEIMLRKWSVEKWGVEKIVGMSATATGSTIGRVIDSDVGHAGRVMRHRRGVLELLVDRSISSKRW